jgi:hypothetical protein
MKTSTMKKIFTVACAVWALLAMPGAQAGGISDSGAGAYWGADGHGKTDVIGDSTYDISGATITRIANVLTITIATNFAGHAGAEEALVGHGGIGYGDVFLAKAWNPFGSDVNHASDSAINGTLWSYGLSLDKRWSNTGGTFKVYSLGGTTNAASILNSDSFISCGSNCLYRNGQATAVDTSGTSKASATAMSGTWTVLADSQLQFKLDLTGSNSDLLNFSSFAMHWGETCQNDVIEGVTSVVSAPGSIPLLALGLGTMLLLRRRQAGLPAKS